MKTLLDTCVLSELTRPSVNTTVRDAIRDLGEENTFVSVVSIGEIARGIALLAEGERKRALSAWLQGLLVGYRERLLDIDVETAQIWGEITAVTQQHGRQIAAADGLIAATALQHGLQVGTRNIKDFEPANVRLFNPWHD